MAALLSPKGKNREAIRVCLKGDARPLFGVALFHEYEDLLGRKDLMRESPLTASERRVLFDALLSVPEWIKVYYLWRPNLPDEGDNHLMELAVAGGAGAIVTNNTADLKTGELLFPSVSIFTPTQFLTEFDAETRFRIMAARGSAAKGLKLLDKLGKAFAKT